MAAGSNVVVIEDKISGVTVSSGGKFLGPSGGIVSGSDSPDAINNTYGLGTLSLMVLEAKATMALALVPTFHFHNLIPALSDGEMHYPSWLPETFQLGEYTVNPWFEEGTVDTVHGAASVQ